MTSTESNVVMQLFLFPPPTDLPSFVCCRAYTVHCLYIFEFVFMFCHFFFCIFVQICCTLHSTTVSLLHFSMKSKRFCYEFYLFIYLVLCTVVLFLSKLDGWMLSVTIETVPTRHVTIAFFWHKLYLLEFLKICRKHIK